jgi:anti-sigma-K factor RskA
MAFTLGVLQNAAYDRFFLGLWTIGISLLLAVVAVVAILIASLSSTRQGKLPLLSTAPAAPGA